MCGGKKPPTQATVDPAVERQKAADDAARKANKQLVMENRRRRGQQGLLSGEETGSGSVLARAAKVPAAANNFGLLGRVMKDVG